MGDEVKHKGKGSDVGIGIGTSALVPAHRIGIDTCEGGGGH